MSRRTLPEWLCFRAEQHGAALALREKKRGVWSAQTWKEIAASVAALAEGLRGRGFREGDRLIIDAAPSAAAFHISLAVFWLGGAVVVADAEATENGTARFAFAADDAARERLLTRHADATPLALGIQLRAGDGADTASGWVSLGELASTKEELAAVPPVAPAWSAALVRRAPPARDQGSAGTEEGRGWFTLTQADLVRDAGALLASGRIGAEDEALAWHALPLAAWLESVLAAWLIGGFTFNFVESTETEDADRRELGPSLVFGGGDDYASLIARTTRSLPPREGLERRWLESALAARGTVARLLRPLVVHRLREVTGFGRLERAIVLGDTPAPAGGLERLFGRSAFHFRSGARVSEPLAAGAEPVAASSLLGLDPGPLGASSRSDLA